MKFMYRCLCLLGALTLWLPAARAQTITGVAGGGDYSLFLRSDGSVWAAGENDAGQLGDGTYSATNLPQKIAGSGVTAIAAGSSHSLFLKADGSLWGMGDNSIGELAQNSNLTETNVPVEIMPGNVTAIAAADGLSLFLKSDGSLWGMGLNQDGQLGDGRFNAGPLGTYVPVEIVSSNVTAVAAGGYHGLFIKNDGSLWGMGDNAQGQLGDGTTNNVDVPEELVSSGVAAVAAGFNHTLFLKDDGSLWAMGSDNAGQLGNGEVEPFRQGVTAPVEIVSSNVTAMAAGFEFSLFIKTGGSLWAFGENNAGQLGDGTYNNTNQPEEIVSSNVTAIAAGGYHALYIKNDGSAWVTGNDAFGGLGDGVEMDTNRPEPVTAFAPGYNVITPMPVKPDGISLAYRGATRGLYALDRSLSLSGAVWTPQYTNSAGSAGMLVFTNTPKPGTNNFWRVRFVPQ